MTRAEAMTRVRELLHGEEAKACMPMDLRFAIDLAVCEYGNAAVMEVIDRQIERSKLRWAEVEL